MLNGLEKFISLDNPFRLEERRTRMTLLDLHLVSKISASEQLRQVLEAYNRG